MCEMRGYLELVVDMAEKEQLSQPSEGCIPNAMVQLAEKALYIAKRWNKLQRKVKLLVHILQTTGITNFRFELRYGLISLLILIQFK